MSLTEIIKDSIKYPLNDYTKFLIVGIISLIAGLTNILANFQITDTAILAIAGIISLIFALILSGYSLDVIKKGIDKSDEIPELDIIRNFVNGIKALVVSIIYLIIPTIILLVFAFITGAIGASIDHFIASLGIVAIISIILYILFGIFEIVALARLAKTESIGDALSIGDVFEDVKSIGFLNIIAYIILAAIIIIIVSVIGGIIALIPYIGIIIASILVGGFVILFTNKALGLLYALHK